MIGRLAAILALAASGMGGAALAQETPFTPQATEACLAAATEEGVKAACLGLSANACMAAQPGGPSTAGDGACYAAETAYWDRRLNADYAELLKLEEAQAAEDAAAPEPQPAPQASPVEALRTMERAWIAYRDAACAYEYSTWGGGTGGGPAQELCLLILTGRQALDLELRLSELKVQE